MKTSPRSQGRRCTPRMHLSPQEWLQMNSTWIEMKSSTEEDLLLFKKKWKTFTEEVEEHSSHPVILSCLGCKRQYCEHIYHKYLCLLNPVCMDCDYHVKPNPYNPKNADLVAYYGISID